MNVIITFLFLHTRLDAVISCIAYLSDVSCPILVNTPIASSDISTSSSSHLDRGLIEVLMHTRLPIKLAILGDTWYRYRAHP